MRKTGLKSDQKPREMEDLAATNGSKNQPVIFRIYRGEIVLDIATTFTYHSQAFATGLTVSAEEIFHGNGLNRGADSHDE